MRLNILSYLLDICVTLLLCIFISAFLYQGIFNFIGLCLTLELLVWIPFVAKLAVDNMSIPSLLHIPFLILFFSIRCQYAYFFHSHSTPYGSKF